MSDIKFRNLHEGEEIFGSFDMDQFQHFNEILNYIQRNKTEIEDEANKDPLKFYNHWSKKISKILPDIFFTIPDAGKNIMGSTFQRCSSFTGLDPENIEHFYCPPDYKTGLNRCNIPGNPVLYLSSHFSVSTSEVIQSATDFNKPFYISDWKIRPNSNFYFTPFFSPEFYLQKFVTKSLSKTFRPLTNRDRVIVFKTADLLIQSFRMKEHVLSSIIAHKFIYDNPCETPVLFGYNSVLSTNESLNYSLHPNMINSIFYIHAIYEVKFEPHVHKDQYFLKFSIKRYANVTDNKIQWKPFDKYSSEERINILSGLKGEGIVIRKRI